jgi:hypothetical protein
LRSQAGVAGDRTQRRGDGDPLTIGREARTDGGRQRRGRQRLDAPRLGAVRGAHQTVALRGSESVEDVKLLKVQPWNEGRSAPLGGE